MTVDELIEELEKHRGKDVAISKGMTYRWVSHIEEEKEESNMIYIVPK